MGTGHPAHGEDVLLRVRDLRTSFFTPVGEVRAVGGVSFDVRRGEVLGIVGESGSGKSVTMLSVLRLLGTSGRIVGGEIEFDGVSLTTRSEAQMADLRGRRISMIFQDPMTSLNPVLSVGYQMREPLLRHGGRESDGGVARIVEMLRHVGIEPAEQRVKQYPHQFSGGQRQRIMIAMALICNPDLLIADEPTTALDVTVQAQILELMKGLQRRFGTSIILITHDLGVIAGTADRVLVMYGGHIVEEGTRRDIFYAPAHPYTRGLLQSVPNPETLSKSRLIPIEGQPPDLLNPPPGCPYSARCPQTMRVCLAFPPPRTQVSDSHAASCWLAARKLEGGAV
ncbi:MAG: ABC transporter ATP-binding protein [Fretibacterium sp.]|nr:ABC transporter ATP-binding protein [Fretibacterium sp.]